MFSHCIYNVLRLLQSKLVCWWSNGIVADSLFHTSGLHCWNIGAYVTKMFAVLSLAMLWNLTFCHIKLIDPCVSCHHVYMHAVFMCKWSHVTAEVSFRRLNWLPSLAEQHHNRYCDPCQAQCYLYGHHVVFSEHVTAMGSQRHNVHLCPNHCPCKNRQRGVGPLSDGRLQLAFKFFINNGAAAISVQPSGDIQLTQQLLWQHSNSLFISERQLHYVCAPCCHMFSFYKRISPGGRHRYTEKAFIGPPIVKQQLMFSHMYDMMKGFGLWWLSHISIIFSSSEDVCL